jgi:type III secretion system FlhB-like substrate exporter
MTKLPISDIVRKNLKNLKTYQANARYANTVSAPKITAKRTIIKSALGKAAKENVNKAAGKFLTKAISKVAVPLAIAGETYNAGTKIKEFVSGIKGANKESKDWVAQSTANSNDIMNILKKRKQDKLRQAKGK